MKIYQIPLTEQELEVVVKVLDKASISGLETHRVVVRIADKILGIMSAAEKVEKKAPESEAPKPEEN